MSSDHNVATCDGCLARIRWAITEHGRRQAIDADPNADGNLAAHVNGTGTLKVRVLTKERDRLEGTEWRAMPHVATCRNPRPRVPRSSRQQQRRPVVRPGTWRWTR
ncbi:hypothetical protein [Streptomyces sp. NPDC005732]|uniref:hypothetical protein n=1 Tax=Streptomyces sp. NPDC005732 TaxID=3157057 RepID=UPI00340487D8